MRRIYPLTSTEADNVRMAPRTTRVVDRRGYVEGLESHPLQLPGEETPDERRYLVKRGLK